MTQTSDEDRLLVHAYVDGELDPANARALEARIEQDPWLAAERDRIEALQHVLRTQFPIAAPPAGLRERIERAAGLRRAPARPTWAAMAASVALALMLGSGSTFVALAPRGDATADAVVADHIRALMAPQPADVASSDRHTVKPWFNGKIAESPRVVDLAKQDFPLLGGRIDVIGRQPAPVLVYGHRKHVISLTALPAPGKPDAAPAARTSEGYHLLAWTAGGTTYWAVSDVAAADLAHFAELFRTAPAEQ
ncbi:MAG TPA: anti-sigma factor [Xanthobacteraceae bacterium]|nr:anti-sigma factor [Xanthobacteraceae bacterium]